MCLMCFEVKQSSCLLSSGKNEFTVLSIIVNIIIIIKRTMEEGIKARVFKPWFQSPERFTKLFSQLISLKIIITVLFSVEKLF